MIKLCEVMDLPKGVTAFVGGGGKSTCIAVLADELIQEGHRVIITTTTKIYAPQEGTELLLSPTKGEVEEALTRNQLVIVGSEIRDNKLIGIKEELIEELNQVADYILVEADGSRRLPLKVPRSYEPVIPSCAIQVVAVIGGSVLGERISTHCCRAEEVAAFLGKSLEDKVTLQDLSNIICSREGLSKNVEHKIFQVLLNQSDLLSVELQTKMREISDDLRSNGIEPIILASLHNKNWEII